MTGLLKAVLMSLVIALSLTSDTASSSTPVQSGKFQVQVSELRSSTSSASFVAITPMLPSWECRNCLGTALRQAQGPYPVMPPCAYQMP